MIDEPEKPSLGYLGWMRMTVQARSVSIIQFLSDTPLGVLTVALTDQASYASVSHAREIPLII